MTAANPTPVPRRRDHILCVDDDEGVLNVLRQQLRARFAEECEISIAQSGRDALDLVRQLAETGEYVAVVVADQIMPEMSGVELLEAVSRLSPATTKILLTGQAGLDAVTQAINRAGLNHYLPKPWEETELRLAVETLLRQYRLVRQNQGLVAELAERNRALTAANEALEARVSERTRELAEANARLAQLAVTDGLTGLYNHRHFHERLALELERSGRNGLPVSLLMLDVDYFKGFNDAFGHPAGDELLRRLARTLGEGRRANDVVARYGGEEFALVLVDTPKLTAAQIAERLRERIAELPVAPGQHVVTVSLGVASFPEDGKTAEAMVRAADTALYRAKTSGRNRVVLASRQPDGEASA